jgi:hypothetical protein
MPDHTSHPRPINTAFSRRAFGFGGRWVAVSVALFLSILMAAGLATCPSHAARIAGAVGYYGRILPGGQFVEGSTLDKVYGIPVTLTLTDDSQSLVFNANGLPCRSPGAGFCFSLLIHSAEGDLLDRIDGVSAERQTVSGGLPDAILIGDPDFAGFGLVIVLPGRPDPVTGTDGNHSLDLRDIPFRHADANLLVLSLLLATDEGEDQLPDDGRARWIQGLNAQGIPSW